MNRKLILLNLALVALVATLGWAFRQRYKEAKRIEEQALRRSPQGRLVSPLPPVAAPAGVQPVEYIGVAQQFLFSRDRNPNVEPPPPPPAPPPPPPMPPLPEAHGVMNMFGDHVVILSTAKDKQKSYRVGDQIDVFKIVSFDSENIVFEWDGKEVKRTIRELLAKGPAPQQQAAQPQMQSQAETTPNAPPALGISSVSELSSAKAATEQNPNLGTAMGNNYYACKAGDNSPDGTVVNGHKKRIAMTLAGKSCHWEKVN